jgi:hypothetical protein
VDDGLPWAAPQQWPDATASSDDRFTGVDYTALNSSIARYFEDPKLVSAAKTRAIAVVYKARRIVLFALLAFHYICMKSSEAVRCRSRLPMRSSPLPAPACLRICAEMGGALEKASLLFRLICTAAAAACSLTTPGSVPGHVHWQWHPVHDQLDDRHLLSLIGMSY